MLLDYTNPLVDLSYYEINNVPVTTTGGGGGYQNIYIPVSGYPNLDKQVQIGNIITNSSNGSSSTTVLASVFLSDPDNWGIPMTNPTFYAGYVNFSGARHTTTGTVTLTTDAPV